MTIDYTTRNVRLMHGEILVMRRRQKMKIKAKDRDMTTGFKTHLGDRKIATSIRREKFRFQ